MMSAESRVGNNQTAEKEKKSRKELNLLEPFEVMIWHLLISFILASAC